MVNIGVLLKLNIDLTKFDKIHAAKIYLEDHLPAITKDPTKPSKSVQSRLNPIKKEKRRHKRIAPLDILSNPNYVDLEENPDDPEALEE